MASSLKRVVDYKLLYDCLAEPGNGMIKLTTLTTRWPSPGEVASSASQLPRGLPEQWRSAADDNGYLDWEKFSSALHRALEDDAPRLAGSERTQQTATRFEDDSTTFGHEQTAKSSSLAPRVGAEEIEEFLSRCRGEVLAHALSRTRKEVYKCQMSLHQMESASADKERVAKQQRDTKAQVKVPLVNSLSAAGREKEELLKGMEVMEITRLWFSSRLEQLSLEDRQPSKQLKPEELLAALDRREGQSESETIRHIQEINAHLGLLAKEAPGLSLEQAKKQYEQQQKTRGTIKNVASDPGPFAHNSSKPLVSSQVGSGAGGGASGRSTPKVQMNFPAYSPATRVSTGPSPSHSSSLRSSSMREMHNIRGEAEAPAPGQRSAHHGVSMSTQNLSDHQRQDKLSERRPHPHERPRRSHSFNERSMSSGSLATSSSSYGSGGSSVSSTATTSSEGSRTTDYPRSSLHSYSHVNQYPLRGSSSLQTLPSGGGARSAPSGNLQKHSSQSSGGYQGQRSSSVRNLPSASTSFTMATTTASSMGSGRPIISQPTSATARVESVDIPAQPRPMAAVTDLSSSYPGHGHGQRRSGGHAHSGTRGRNPKPSRRHLQQAVEVQSQRIRQLEAENAVLTKDRGQTTKRAPPTSSSGRPVINTSALQSVV